MYDLVIIGGGVSGSLTLIYLLEELQRRAMDVGGFGWTPASFRAAWVDRVGDFGAGLPYGHAAHPKFLLNNDVASMNVGAFHAWLPQNRANWMRRLEQEPDPTVQSWLERHTDGLRAAAASPDLYLSMYLPRFVFGMFLSNWLAESLDRARRLGVTIDLIADEAIAVGRAAGGLNLGLRHSQRLPTHNLLLGLGSLAPDPEPELEGVCGYVHDWRMPDGGASFRDMVRARSIAKNERCDAVIIGSHAAAMESLYTIAHDAILARLLQNVCVVSPSGALPHAISPRTVGFQSEYLEALQVVPAVSADALISAALSDAANGERKGFTSADCSGAIVAAFGKVFCRLSVDEKRRFVEAFGPRFTALSRHTPPDYADAATSLRREGKLCSLAGEVLRVAQTGAQFTLSVRRTDTQDLGNTEMLTADVIVNCRGAGLLSRSHGPFLRDLLDSRYGLARINSSGQGIAVSGEFEASPGVFVVGPLLAGHSEEPFHLWNLERADRIAILAEHAARIITRRIHLSHSPLAAAAAR